MDTKVLNREWVKNAAIIFLAVLLVLTFFSNTILNRSLPEAATKQVVSGPIVAKVRGSGTVAANGTHEVKMKQTKEIRAVMVKVGDEVKTGDVLFVLGAGDSKELEAAKDTLRDLKYSYQRAAISSPNFDYTAQNRALANAEAELKRAKEAYDDAKELYSMMEEKLLNDEDTKDNMQQLQNAKEAMSDAYENLITIQRNYDETYQALSAEVSAWQQRVNELTVIATPEPEVEDEPEIETPPAREEAEETEAAEESEESEAEAEPLSWRSRRPGSVRLSAMGMADARVSTGANPADVHDLATAQSWLSAAQNTLNNFISSNAMTLDSAQSVYDTAKAKYDALVRYNETIFYELVPYREALDRAIEEYDDAQADYNDAWSALYYTQSNNDKTQALASLELQQIAEKIAIQEEKVKALSGETEDQVLANVNGIVRSVDCTAGDTVTNNGLLCTIEVPDMGHTISFSVTNEQARRLRLGDTASISNFYWGNEIVATLSNIRTDPKNPQSNKLLTFDLDGDVESGSELTLSVGSKSAEYDLIVPNSAIKTDSNGSFVLVIEAKNSPLGSRYIAKRVGVEVLASDDNNSAVIAEIASGDFVITTSSAPIKNGDQVRLADS